MSSLLKNQVSLAFVSEVAQLIEKAEPPFRAKNLIKKIQSNYNWESLELKQRVRALSVSIGEELKLPYRQQLKVLVQIAPQVRGLGAMFLPDFVEVHGEHDRQASLKALSQMTSYFSAEFAIRIFIAQDPEGMLCFMKVWAKDKNVHLRRLASEGMRPHLPWALKVKWLNENPQKILPLLEILKEDSELYVRKSVANHLNDISKSYPDLVIKTAKSWKGKSPKTDWIIRHGLRTLLKKGHPGALALYALSDIKVFKFTPLKTDKKNYQIGDSLIFSFDIKNIKKTKSRVRLDYAIQFASQSAKQRQKVRRKVFIIGEYELQAGQSINFKRTHSLRQMTTRKHYPGVHVIELLVNGLLIKKNKFNLLLARRTSS